MTLSLFKRVAQLHEAIRLIDEMLESVPTREEMPLQVRHKRGFFDSGLITRGRADLPTTVVAMGITNSGHRVDLKKTVSLGVQLENVVRNLELEVPVGCELKAETIGSARLICERSWRPAMEGLKEIVNFQLKLATEEVQPPQARNQTHPTWNKQTLRLSFGDKECAFAPQATMVIKLLDMFEENNWAPSVACKDSTQIGRALRTFRGRQDLPISFHKNGGAFQWKKK